MRITSNSIKRPALFQGSIVLATLRHALKRLSWVFETFFSSFSFLKDKTIIVEEVETVNSINKTFDFTKMTANQTMEILQKYDIHQTLNKSSGQIVNYTTIRETRSYKIGKGLKQSSNSNFLGLIIFAIIVGKIAGGMGDRAKPFVDFVSVFNDIITQMVVYIMW